MSDNNVQCGRCGGSFPLVDGEVQKHPCLSPKDRFNEEFENLKRFVAQVEKVVSAIPADEMHPSWQMGRRLTASSRDELARALVALRNPKEV